MAIIFNCPNGHKLNCPEQQAGKPGKCPRCGAVFQVPAAGAAAGHVAQAAAAGAVEYSLADTHTASEHTDGQGAATRPQPAAATASIQAVPAAETTAGAQAAAGPPAAGPQPGDFMFLCPNGHRLHGPTNLVGKPGQCPHCSARFVVPSPDDIPDDEETAHHLEQVQIQVDATPKLPSSSLSVLNPGKSPSAPAGQHPLAALFAQLWSKRTQGVSIELHLGDGKLLIPDQYSQRLHADYGLFVTREANGTLTLTAVAWESISRVAVRGLSQLPKEFFDARG